jgi:ribosome biogenesis GTPase / thiamine phosphate phosphatase
LKGEILGGINNIYTVRLLDAGSEAEGTLLCRIRGKVLREADRSHNPITAGDVVELERDSHSAGEGRITEVLPRRSVLVRYNRNSRSPQVLAANVDLLVCVTSVRRPPFRPRFLDRLLVSGHRGGVEPIVFANKCDLGADPATEERLADYERIGYRVLRGSAASGEGIAALADALAGRTSVFAGQSGVGKSSLLNALDPSLRRRVGDISSKHDRGAHTTNSAILATLARGGRVIDTPGIRELDLYDIPSAELGHYYPDFRGPARECSFATCTHTSEEHCAVRNAVEAGTIHTDRYESYVRAFVDLVALERKRYG